MHASSTYCTSGVHHAGGLFARTDTVQQCSLQPRSSELKETWYKRPCTEFASLCAVQQAAARGLTMAKDKKKAKKRKAEAAAAAAADAPASSTVEESVDDIFAALKKEKRPPKAEKPTTKKPRRDAEAERKEDDKWRAGRPPTPPGRQENPQVHRYAADGLPVYKYFHLGMDQQDGGTPLCPFDCDCCF